MKLRSVLFTVAFAIILTPGNELQAQNFYGGLSVGYGMRMGGNDLETESYNSSSGTDFTGQFFSNSSSTTDRVKLSLGKGTQAGLMLGYMMNPNLGLELGLSYLRGGKTEFTSESSSSERDEFFNNFSRLTVAEESTTYSSNMFRVIPTVVLSAGGQKLSPYAKIGFIMGFGKIIQDESYSYSLTSTNFSENYSTDEDVSIEYSSGIAAGMTGVFGLKSTSANGISFFGELFMEYVNYAPKNGEVVVYKEGGVNLLPLLTDSETEFEFVDSISENSSAPANESQPTEFLKESWSFSNIGIRCGIIKNF